ncbi:MAG: serine hydrolase [Nibricoccus sp.]
MTPLRCFLLSFLFFLPTDTLPLHGEGSTCSFADVVKQGWGDSRNSGVVGAEIDGTKISFFAAGNVGVDAPPEEVIFEIGSITKVFTGLLLGQAVVDGMVRLDDPVSKFLPATVKLHPSVAAVTLEQLATHTSGLVNNPDNLTNADPLNPFADYTVSQFYEFLVQQQLEGPAPHPYSYSNAGVGLLGHILELSYHKTFAELVAQKIAQPLGMNDTVVTLSDSQTKRFAAPHDKEKPAKAWLLPTLAGAGALRSTAADMAKLIQTLASENNPLKAAWDVAREPRIKVHSNQTGLGIAMVQRSGTYWYFHAGGTGGFRSMIEFSPEAKRGFVLLANNTQPELQGLIERLHVDPLDPNRPEQPIEPKKLKEYAGIYRVGEEIELVAAIGREKRLLVCFTGQDYGPPLSYAGNDRFFSRKVAAEFEFSRDAHGKIETMTLIQNGRRLTAQRIEE